MKWLEIRILAPIESHDAIAHLCHRLGAQGVRIDQQSITVWLPETPDLDMQREALLTYLSQLQEWGLPPLQAIEEQWREESEWTDTWKQFFGILRVGKRIVIKPSWKTYEPQPGEVVIELDPGMAFGTGQHETTQMCLEFLEELVYPGAVVVDVGTGSGILAIAAAKLGASFVWAGDNDPTAVVVAQRNVARNEVGHKVSVQRAEGCEGAPSCDVLVANLTAEAVLSLLSDFACCLQYRGWLILSGIIAERSSLVAQALTAPLWSDLQVRQRGEWYAFATRKQ